jgi:hypothetical protein
MKYSKQSIIIATFFAAGLLYVAFFKKDYRLQLREQKTEVFVGEITRKYSVYRSSGIRIEYTFKDRSGKIVVDNRNIADVIGSPERFVKKFFPVVVSEADSDENAILITPSDFALFNIVFPDSLDWVVQYVDETQK